MRVEICGVEKKHEKEKIDLRWTPAVAAGFFASVLAHALVVGVG